MKKRKIFLSVVLLLSALLVIGLCACKSTKAADDTTTAGISEPVADVPDITIADNGTASFKIVYPSDSSDTIKEDVSLLLNALKKYSNDAVFELEQVSSKGSYSSEESAIIIGKVKSNAGDAVISEIGYGDWAVRFEGKHLVVTAYSDYALDQAISNFIKEIKTRSNENNIIAFPENFNLTKAFDEVANNLPKYDSETLASSAPAGDDSSLAVIKNTDLTQYNKYLSKLSGLGYTLHTTNVIEKNYFATYYNDEYVIHAGYYGYESSARITVEKKTALVGLKSDNVYTPKSGVTTTLAMMGISTEANDKTDIGMGFIFQLDDGSFLVVDGAFANDASRVYGYMRSLVPEGKLKIAAWIITHNDGDHRSCMPAFIKAYSSETELEQVIINFPHSYAYEEAGTNNNTAPQAAAKEYGCDIIKAHTGQKFYIRNVEVEMLYTLDSYLPTPLTIFNNSSLVFTVTFGADRILFMGDAGDEVAEILNDMYSPEFLRSDFLQLSHHGKRNGHGTKMPETVELYKSIQAEVVMWPSSWGQYLNVDGDAADQQETIFTWNCAATDIAREVYIAGGDEFTVFKLPYKPFSAKKYTH